MIRVDGRVTTIGDVHGQFYSLNVMLKSAVLNFQDPNSKLLFLGDYVDRGFYGPEIVLLLFTLKIKFPSRIYLLRGNHETRSMTDAFNFRDQCINLYDDEFYDRVMEAFDLLPVSAVLNGKYLCMHGGISKQLTSLDDINEIERKQEPDQGLLEDLLWADPAKYNRKDTDYDFNGSRECSVVFGKKPVNDLLQKHALKAIVRAHQVKHQGYKFYLWNGDKEFPPVITVFSAPNYCGHDNEAAVMLTNDEDLFEMK